MSEHTWGIVIGSLVASSLWAVWCCYRAYRHDRELDKLTEHYELLLQQVVAERQPGPTPRQFWSMFGDHNL